MVTIKRIISNFPAYEFIDENKIREKIREVLGSCGLDENLFKIDNKFQFPDESEGFIVEVLNAYSSSYMKLLRKGLGRTLDIPDDKAKWLYEGFSTCLKGMPLDKKVIQKQVHVLDVRLLYSYRKSRRKLDSVISDFSERSISFGECFYSNHLLYEDLNLFTLYIATSLEKLQEEIKDIYSFIEENRLEALYDEAGATGPELNKKILEYDYQESLVWNRLNTNQRFKELSEKLRDMLDNMRKGEHFIRDFKVEYNETMSEITKIRKETEQEVLGHELENVDIPMNLSFDNPVDVLSDAVKNIAEQKLFQDELKNRPPLNEEDIDKIRKAIATFKGKTPSISPHFLDIKK